MVAMDDVGAALIGFGGAIVGAGASFLGAVYNGHRNAVLRRRSRKEDAYDRALYALRRVRNRRERMRIRGYEELDKEIELQLFLQELVDAQHGLSMVRDVCGAEQKEHVETAAHEFDAVVDRLIRPPPKRPPNEPKEQKVRRLATAVTDVEAVMKCIERTQNDDLHDGRRRRPWAIRNRRGGAAKRV
jgi:hypothetical protein